MAVLERGTVTFEQAAPVHVPQSRGHIAVEDDATFWRLDASEAKEGLRLRHAFRDYLEAFGDPASDFDAAEAIYGELVGNCVRHAPGSIRIEFRWEGAALSVIDETDRLRTWPFSSDDPSAMCTHHGYAILSALASRVHVKRDGTGTRATIALPVRCARR